MVLKADHVYEGAALEDPTPQTHRESAASEDRNANHTTTPVVVSTVTPENTTNRTLISEPKIFVPEIEEDPEEEDYGIE